MLSPEETTDFLNFIEEKDLKLKNVAEDSCISYAAFHVAVKENRAVRCWRTIQELKLENKELKEQLAQMKAILKS